MVKGATERMEELANALPSGLSTPRAYRLADLFDDEPDPDAVTLWRVWMDRGRPTDEELARYRELEDVDGFDPVDGQPDTSDKVRAVNAYEDALDAGLESAAGYLRTLNQRQQGQFARFLRREYL